jgi:hypothetical protein
LAGAPGLIPVHDPGEGRKILKIDKKLLHEQKSA